jgi:MFS transporter, AAHS family, 3-hydroxyphenylpropionic acid transporter
MDDARSRHTAARTVLFCFLGALCEGFDVQAAGVAAGGLSRDFRPTPGALGVFFSASGAGLLIGAVVGGRLADRVGRKTVLVASIIAFGIFSFLTSLAGDMPSLTAMRFLTGLGLGAAMPNLIALAADVSGTGSRNTSIAISYVGMPLGGAAASLLVFLLPTGAWRSVFQAGGIAPLLIAPLMGRYLPATKPAASIPTRVSAGMRHELFGQGRAVTTLLLWLGFFLVVLTLHLMLNWLPLLLLGRGLLKNQAAIAQFAFGVSGAAAAFWLGTLLDSRWQRASIAVCLVMLPVVMFFIAVAPARPAVLFGLASLLGSAILAEQVIVFAIASAFYPVAARGTGVGAAVAAGRLGSLVGPLFAASLLAAGRSPAQVLIGVLPIAVVGGICAGFLGWRELRK